MVAVQVAASGGRGPLDRATAGGRAAAAESGSRGRAAAQNPATAPDGPVMGSTVFFISFCFSIRFTVTFSHR